MEWKERLVAVMVDPVNNRGYYEYNRINVKVGTNVENGEKFALNYGKEDEESDKKEDGKTKVETDGVIAEFSSQTQSQYGGVGSRQKGGTNTEESLDLGQTVERAKGFIGELVKAVADFFSSMKKALLDFWNSDSGTQDVDGAVQAEDPDAVIDVTEMSQAIDGENGIISTVEAEGVVERTADAAVSAPEDRRTEAERYLENEEQMKRYVKNSDLLTYYDRSGRIVQMNGADKNRILHGDARTSRRV